MAHEVVSEYGKADLITGNNVVAHVPDIHDFVGGLKILLKKNGVITLEFPHLLELIKNNQFDTIYHEHFSYFSLLTLSNIFDRHDLKIFDVEKLSTHGGSLRIFASHRSGTYATTDFSIKLLEEEKAEGLEKHKLLQPFPIIYPKKSQR